MRDRKQPTFLTRDAASWFVRNFNTRPDAKVQQAFSRHLQEQPEFEGEYGTYDVTVSLLEELRDDPDLAPIFGEARRKASEYKRRRRIGYAMLASAASIVLAVTLVLFVNLTTAPVVYSTMVGEQRTIILPDQSLVRLNTNSRVAVDYDDNERRLRLERGEALFEVVKDPVYPFKVYAAKGVAVAVGTKFNVVATDSGATVTVIEGQVQVIPNADLKASRLPFSLDDQQLLQDGETITYDDSGRMERAGIGDTERINAWQEGKLAFSNMRLQDAVAEHNRYTQVKIVVGDKTLNSMLVSGVLRIGDTTSLIFLLEQTLNLRAVQQDEHIVLLPNDATTARMSTSQGGG